MNTNDRNVENNMSFKNKVGIILFTDINVSFFCAKKEKKGIRNVFL